MSSINCRNFGKKGDEKRRHTRKILTFRNSLDAVFDCSVFLYIFFVEAPLRGCPDKLKLTYITDTPGSI